MAVWLTMKSRNMIVHTFLYLFLPLLFFEIVLETKYPPFNFEK